jgi:TolA-binding protein
MGRARTGQAICGLLLCLFLLAAACADPAQEQYERAEKALLAQRMEAALADFRAIAREHPQSRFAPAALLRLGDLYGAYFRDFPAALEAYDSLAFNYPSASEVPQALLRTAEIHLLQDLDASAAAAVLEKVRKGYPRFDRTDEVLFLLAQAYNSLRDGERQAAVLSELIERYPKSHRAAEGRWMLAYAYLDQRRYDDAEREFRKLLFLAADRRTAARARWGVAQSLEGRGDLLGAIAQYEALRDSWDDPQYVAGKIERLRDRAGDPARAKERKPDER